MPVATIPSPSRARRRAAPHGATLAIGLIGPGRVGQALLRQIEALAPDLQRRQGTRLHLHAIADRRRMRLSAAPLPADALAGTAAAANLDALAAHLQSIACDGGVLVDCSGSDDVATRYADWLGAGLHVATPSKHAGSGPLARWHAIRAAMGRGGQFRYEATVGAGLPVIGTLRSLLDTGDGLLAIEGVLSGTLAWLFNRYDGVLPFSQLVREAHQLGYTEPDPRDDLSGIDVARKLVILAREAGMALSLHDVAVESLVPPALRDIPAAAFLSRLGELDAPMRARLRHARDCGGALRHLARLDRDGTASVSLCSPGPGHAALHGRLSDNVIQFHTHRYADNPLVVQGPGAGPAVTAAGVLGDILAIARAPGARP